MHTVSFSDIRLTDGFWSDKQTLVYEKTVWAVYKRFSETSRILTMDCQDHGVKPDFAWASDVFKWIEGAAYLYTLHHDTALLDAIRDIVQMVEKGVSADGYYSSYYNSPLVDGTRFTDRNLHELYTIGHMLEAGVALYEATGEDTLLTLGRNCADLLYTVFVKENAAAFSTPGHEEIELALMRLYRTTGEERYRELSAFFVDQRGNKPKDKPIRSDFIEAVQSQLPVRAQVTAEGHAVRAVYLYCAMVDLATSPEDELFRTADSLFTDIYEHKAYITGGIGSVDDSEAFARPYYLPNRSAYAETCAALGLALFCRRLYAVKPDGRYGDLAERALFNGMLSGLSLDGTAFFYTNPLAVDLERQGIRRVPQRITQRQHVFRCSCCPPNLVRLIPSIGNFLYTYDDTHVYVHQYFASTGTIAGHAIDLQTRYPQNGKISVKYDGARSLVLRRPAWCQTVKTDAFYREENGYLYFDQSAVDIEFVMQPEFVVANEKVHENSGQVAIVRGPIVYCAEEQDQDFPLDRLTVDTTTPPMVENDTFGGLPKISVRATCAAKRRGLYQPLTREETPCHMTFIPYYSFANREEDNMRVWMRYR